jgi:diaminohydroxyphosphoribosylaminopyrimidine deaminase / 5-amino-6-(5-phosphoribosylamino)uracil reductase
MRRALELAEHGAGLASPNPMVGAVIVGEDGNVAGEGWHEGPGTPHAEVVALRAAGERARGATLYVTLEPCSHHGHTPPCAPVVRDSGVARIVAGTRDPNPIVDGRGLALLRDAGIAVTEGVLAREAARLIEGFARHVTTGLPFVTVKLAASLDGKVAARDGTSRWITGPEAREDVHRLRARSDAIVVGSVTALTDDPSLSVRLPGYRGRQPLRVIADSTGRTPVVARVFGSGGPVVMATTSRASRAVRDAWEAAGGETVVLEGDDDAGAVDLGALMASLGKRGIQSVLIEGGPTLAWSAIRSDVVDRLVLYIAPKLVGGEAAPGILGGDGVATIADALAVDVVDLERVGKDLKVTADVHRDR